MKPKVFAIIINLNGKRHIIHCLKSLTQLSVENLKIIVVDNNSTDGSIEIIKRQFPKVEIIHNKVNLGYAGGVNKGVKWAMDKNADYVLILNNDTVFGRNFLSVLLKTLEERPKVGILGSKIYFYGNSKKIWFAGGIIDRKRFSGGHIGYKEKDKGQYDNLKEVDFITGCTMLIKHEVFEKIGFFDNRYFLYYEDVDFCVRAKRAGFKIIFVPQSILYHKVSAGKENSPFMSYLLARNHFLFLEKNAPFNIKIREFLRLPKTIYEHYKKDEKFALLGIRDYFLRRFGNRDYWS